jgi:hypothetical protein
MARQARAHGWWAGGILAALLVTGCTTGGTPGPTPTAPSTGPSPTSATTTSTSATSALTTGSAATGAIPAAARVDSVDGSVEFVKFLVTEVNRAYRTPKAAILDSYIAASCVGCQDLRTDIADVERLSQHAVSDTWSVTFCFPNTWSPGAATTVLRIHQKRVDFVDSQGRKVDDMVEGDFEYFLTLTYDSGWRVSRWQKT